MITLNINNQTIQLEQIENKLKITFADFKETSRYNDLDVQITLEGTEIWSLLEILIQYSDGNFIKEERAYSEDIYTYRDEVEKILMLSGQKGKLTIDCYTEIPCNDNWIILNTRKLNDLIGLMYGYMN